jgi:DNA mismatch repair ATPase MutS
MAIAFLKDALIDEQTVTPGNYFLYQPENKGGEKSSQEAQGSVVSQSIQHMVLDAQALQHLEIVESAAGDVKGSLFHYIDHTKTQFGRRHLKRWLMSPLLIPEKINARLDAVDDLMAH